MLLQQLAVAVAAQALLDFARARVRPARIVHFGASPACTIIKPSARSTCSSGCMRSQSSSSSRVVGEQHFAQLRIDLALLVALAFGDRQQRQVVVAERDDAVRAQRMHQAQRFQRLAAAVDQVAAEPQRVARRDRTAIFSSRRCESGVAALQVADAQMLIRRPSASAISAACAGWTA